MWRRLQADIYNAACVTTTSEEGPAYGAAILAAVGVGEYKSVPEACKAMVRVRQTIRPNARRARRYAELHGQYQRLYPALKDEFVRMAALAEQTQGRRT
jgi:xylulokinase